MYSVSGNSGWENRPAVDSALVRARNEREELLRHFGFRESPFGVTPNPAFLYLSRRHRAALQALIHSIESNLGFTVLLGGPGTGKTTLLFQILTQYRECARTAFIFQTQCKPHDLLRYIACELELPGYNRDEVSLHQRLKLMLVKEARAGRKVLIVVDEAQNLQQSSLEAIRLLSDFETAPAKLLHVILAGSSQLGDRLLAPDLSQFAQRVSTVCRLEPLTAEEVRAYVAFRLGVAGRRAVENLFSPESLAEVTDLSGGVPRLVNSICYRALSLAYARGERRVSAQLMQQAARDLELSASTPGNPGFAGDVPERNKHYGCTQAPATVASKEESAPVRAKPMPDGASGTPGDVNVRSHSAARPMVARSDPPYSDAQSNTIPAAQRTRPRAAQVSDGSGRQIRTGRFIGFNAVRLKTDRSSTLLGALILIALGVLIGWHALRARTSTPIQHNGEVQRSVASSAVTSPEVNHSGPAPSAVSQPSSMIATNESKAAQTIHRPIRAATTPTMSTVIETPPDGVRPSRIDRRSFSQTNATEQADVPKISPNSEPLELSLATVPAPLPQLHGTAGEAANLRPASSLQPTKVVQPEYPTIARLRHVEGEVVLELEVDSRGNVQKVHTISGNSLLTQAAQEAAKQWHYPPSPQSDISVPAVTQVRFKFKLDPEARK